MAWNTLIFSVFFMLVCTKAISVSKQSKSTRGCFAELKCGGEIKEIRLIQDNQFLFFVFI